jgi:uncharacterized protein YggU (UPF0235/DUF167 family)
MKLTVNVKTNSGTPGVIRTGPVGFEVAVGEPPAEGRANKAMLRALARFLDVAPSRLRIVSGHTFRTKVVELV